MAYFRAIEHASKKVPKGAEITVNADLWYEVIEMRPKRVQHYLSPELNCTSSTDAIDKAQRLLYICQEREFRHAVDSK